MRERAARITAPTALRAALALVATATSLIALVPGADATATAPRTVTIGDFYYAPKVARIATGQKVRFVNRGRIDHTVADVDLKGSILGRRIKPRLLTTGGSQVVTFRRTGVIRYVCTLHPTRMSGTLIVTRP